jgi:hypothetical protein
MKRFILCSATLLFVNFSYADTTYVNGNVSGNWTTDGNPYIVTGNLLVPANLELLLDNGVRVEFRGPQSITVNGLLSCAPGPDTTRFTQDTIVYSNRWQGLRFTADIGVSTLHNTLFEFGNAYTGTVQVSSFATTHLRACTFRDCAVSALVIDNAQANVLDCSFERCGISGGCGGAIRAHEASVQLSQSTFRNCGALDGGALCFYNSLIEISSCDFRANRATLWGGVIYADNTTLHVTSSWFALNQGLLGGVFLLEHGTDVLFEYCVFRDNTGDRDGIHGSYGVGYLPSGANFRFDNCIFDNNCASSVSVIYSPLLSCTFNECVFMDNDGFPLMSGAGIDVSFSDFSPLPTFGPGVPIDLADLATVNANGDSVDVFGNLVFPPDFMDENAGQGSYYPNFTSPLIDAGDTTSGFEGDGTYPEIGVRHYLHFPPVDDLTLHRVDQSNDLLLRWTQPGTNCHFRIYRSQESEWDWSTVEIVAETADTFYVHQGALTEPITKYIYRISSFDCEFGR